MMKTQVVKIGGSLFDFEPIAYKLARWREDQENARQVFVIGGGEIVEQVRVFEQRFALDEKVSHELSCELMGVTCRLATAWLPNVPVVASVDFVRQSDQSLIFDPRRWLVEDLPTDASWDATSDSIAAALANEIGAEELVLMKSLPVKNLGSVVEASSKGYVDLCFPKYAAEIETVKLVNLRADVVDEVELN